jgi:hypothetical protein
MTIISASGKAWKTALMPKKTVSSTDKSSALMSVRSARDADVGCVYNHSMHTAIRVQTKSRKVTTLAEGPKIVFPAGTPMDDVLNTIEALAKGSVRNDKEIVDLIKVVSDGADKGDRLLLEGIDKLAKVVQDLIAKVKEHEQRLAMLESKETKH